ncbi:hypothetical protein LY28_01337 [Ruminiclostridium sufflavum DSM 19573]|uniref:Uncharacterized protein n=1 Tax=Ruminiclostridium sufflavum DSM 19573 TaxID=1121337 RepID=A0A318XLI6_9FIRM|nr:hypothetical protein [Ruminiclostridium sufflavum]PYG88488.1 hypothetical protein LY28_01337 [Ruminiclostridium sufflavum DSM 19573]
MYMWCKKVQIKSMLAILIAVTLMIVSIPTVSAASYYPQTFTHTEQFYVAEGVTATFTAEVTIWYYTDNKIHIYSENLSCSVNDSRYRCYTYGLQITNGNGLLSTSVGYATVSGPIYSKTMVANVAIVPGNPPQITMGVL